MINLGFVCCFFGDFLVGVVDRVESQSGNLRAADMIQNSNNSFPTK